MSPYAKDFKVGTGVAWDYRDAQGILRTLTGKVTALYHLDSARPLAVVRSDGGQPGYPRGKQFEVSVRDLWILGY